MEKHLQPVELKLKKLQEFNYSAQDILLEKGEIGNLKEWSSFMGEKMTRFDDVDNRLKSEISNVEKKEEAKAKHEENITQEEMFRRRMQEEFKIQEMKLQMKSKEYEKRDKIVNEERVNVKLSKLAITKFDGRSLDLLHFWKQFESAIDKPEICSESKFSYLKELLVPRVGLLIDGLPFTSESYPKVKSILLGKFRTLQIPSSLGDKVSH